MKFKRKIAAVLTAVMAFSALATFDVAAARTDVYRGQTEVVVDNVARHSADAPFNRLLDSRGATNVNRHNRDSVDLIIPVNRITLPVNPTADVVIQLSFTGSRINFATITGTYATPNTGVWQAGPTADGVVTDSGWVGGNPTFVATGSDLVMTGAAALGDVNLNNRTSPLFYTGLSQPGIMEVPFQMNWTLTHENALGHAGNSTGANLIIDRNVMIAAQAFNATSGNYAYIRVPLVVQLTGAGPASVEVRGNVQGFGTGNRVEFTAGVATGTASGRAGALRVGTDRITLHTGITVRENIAGVFSPRTMLTAPAAYTAVNELRGLSISLPGGYEFQNFGTGTNQFNPGSVQITVPNLGQFHRLPQATGTTGNNIENWNENSGLSSTQTDRGQNFMNQHGVFERTPSNAAVAARIGGGTENPNSSADAALRNYFYFSDNGRVLNLIFGSQINSGIPNNTIQRTISINHLWVGHEDILNPNFASNIEATVTAIGSSGVSTASFPIATLQPEGLNLARVSGAYGEIQTITSGRVFSPAIGLGTGLPNPTQANHFAGRSSRVTLAEVVPATINGNPFTLTLTDSEGNVLPQAKIAGIEMRSTTGGTPLTDSTTARHWWHNIVPQDGVATSGEMFNTAGFNTTPTTPPSGWVGNNFRLVFTPDGHSVTVHGWGRNSTENATLELTVFLSTDVNFEGDVFLYVAGGRGAAEVNNNNIQIASVERAFDISVETTTTDIGFASVPVGEIVIQERESGALVQGRDLTVGIQQFGVTTPDIQFNPVRAADIVVTTPHTNQNNRAAFTLQNANQRRSSIDLTVQRASAVEPSRIVLTNLNVFIDRSTPFGSYDLVISGRAVLDNDAEELNQYQGNADRMLRTNERGFRRYAFGGLIHEHFLNIATPGVGAAGAGLNNVIGVQADSARMVINGVETTMYNADRTRPVTVLNRDDRTFLPVRAVSYAFGATSENILWDPQTATVVITIDNRTVSFTAGSEHYTVNGIPLTLPARAFIDPATYSMYIPFRELGQAFGVRIGWDAATGTAWFNGPAQFNIQ